MKRNLLLFLSFGCLGITTEIFFTAIMDNIIAVNKGGKVDVSLTGHSYAWMFFIYGFGVLAFRPVYNLLGSKPILLRITIYAICIVIIEFITGFLLDTIIGHCPWHYTEGIHIMGFARLDYLPFWMIFAFFMEKVYLFINKLEFS